MVDHVNLGVAWCHAHHLLGTVVVAKSLGVHQHTARGTFVKPSQIQHWLRLAGTQEVPFAISPGLYPCMVIIGMRPTRRINLTGRNTHRTQRSHRKGTLLATATIGRTERSQWTAGTSVRRAISHVLVAPVVHFENGVLHAQFLHTWLQRLVEHLTRVVQILIVHTHGHHKMAELPFGHRLSPWQSSLGLKSQGYVFLIKITRVVGFVGLWHKLVKECHIIFARLRLCLHAHSAQQ